MTDTLGNRIRWLRGTDSQEEFAGLLGVHKETVGKYERDKILPGSDVLLRLHQLRQVDINWLLTGAGDPQIQKGAPGMNHDAMIASVVAIDELLLQRQKVLPAEKKAKLYMLVYKQLIRSDSAKIEPAMLNDLLDLAS